MARAVVLESGPVFLSSRTCLGLVGIWTRTCLGLGHRTRQMFKLVSTESSNICFFFLFQNKDSLVPQMGNVIAIGLTPSRTGIVIGRLLNPQLRHMSVRLLCGGINYLYFGHRHAVGKLHYTVWLYKVRWSFPSHFPSLLNTLLMPCAFYFHFHFRSIAYL